MKYTAKVQLQPVYSIVSDRKYYRLRIPKKLAIKYIEQNGEHAYIHVYSDDTFRINCIPNDTPIHILEVAVRRGIEYNQFYQIIFPVVLAGAIQKGDRVRVRFRSGALYLKFEHNV